jgi:hypothetical protein
VPQPLALSKAKASEPVSATPPTEAAGKAPWPATEKKLRFAAASVADTVQMEPTATEAAALTAQAEEFAPRVALKLSSESCRSAAPPSATEALDEGAPPETLHAAPPHEE